MIIGALGCNLAWGIIDAAFYLIGVIVERGRSALLLRRVQQAADPATGRALVAETLPPPVATALAPQELERVRALIAGLPEPPPRVKLARQDLLGALAVFLLVFLSTFPVVVPFFFGADLDTALRISNGVAIALIFGATYRLALTSGLRPFRTAAAMVGLGGLLVAVAIALGG
jgi:VIT1/CCC1 family predicted Fe2+/Mn2+ transporter